MPLSYETYKVAIVDREFHRSDGYSTGQTAIVTLYNQKGSEITQLHLAVPNLSEIYETIGRGEKVCFDRCYVKGFSATACKRYLEIPKQDFLTVNGIEANEAFFESSVNIDFSLIRLTTDCTINDSYLAAPTIDFHSSKQETGSFRLTNCHIKTDRFNFVQFAFCGKLLSFKNSIFDHGSKDFQDTDFGNGEVVFTNTDFGNGDVSFINTAFNNSRVSFKVATFGTGKVDFRYAKFGKENLSFERVTFGSGRVDFRAVEFGTGKTSFNRSVFTDGEVNFEGAESCSGRVSLKRIDFGTTRVIFDLYQGKGSSLIFERSTFNAEISFQSASVEELSMEECQFNSTLNLHVDRSRMINLSGCTFRDIVEFYTHDPKPVVSVLNLSGIRLLGQLYISWEENNLKELIYRQSNTSIADKAEQFRILKENFNKLGKYNDEDHAYVEFKRCELEVKRKSRKGPGVVRYIDYLARKLIFDHMGLYATAPQRVIGSILTIYTGYSLVYMLTLLTGIGDIVASSASGESMGIVSRSFYFSVVTFFTIGYGDFSPTGFARIIAGTEGFVGVFLMSYFTVAFVRKILR